MSSFASLGRAQEGYFFNSEERLAVVRRLERLVESGKLDKSALEAIHRFESPIEIITKKENPVFEYKKGLFPPPRPLARFSLGTQFSLGKGRWSAEDVSIFSVADGKRMASTPPKAITTYESIRMAKITKASFETPTMAGYRLLPEFTPGRAMLWGTVIAMWATGAVVASAMRNLDIQGAEDASEKIRSVVAPWAETLQVTFAPLKSGMSIAAASNRTQEDAAESQIVQRLKARFMSA